MLTPNDGSGEHLLAHITYDPVDVRRVFGPNCVQPHFDMALTGRFTRYTPMGYALAVDLSATYLAYLAPLEVPTGTWPAMVHLRVSCDGVEAVAFRQIWLDNDGTTTTLITDREYAALVDRDGQVAQTDAEAGLNLEPGDVPGVGTSAPEEPSVRCGAGQNCTARLDLTDGGAK